MLPLSDGKGGLILGGPTRSRTSVRLERGVKHPIGERQGHHGWRGFSDYTATRPASRPGRALAVCSVDRSGITAEQVAHVSATARDGGVNRHRPLTIIGEQSLDEDGGQGRVSSGRPTCDRRVRARSARITVQGWREVPDGDSVGTRERLVFVADEWLGIAQELLVSSTSQSLSEGGTTTTMDPWFRRDAFVQRAEPMDTGGPLGSNLWE